MARAERRVDAWGDPIGPKELPPLVHVAEREALEVCLRAPLSAKGKGLLLREHSPTEYLHRLLEETSYSDAVHFLAQALPKPLAVRWARIVAHSMEEFSEEERIREAFALIDEWLEASEAEGEEGLLDPKAALREKAAELAEALGYKPASAWVLMAIANSVPAEGADKPELYRPMTGQSAAMAILLSAAAGGEPLIMDHDDQYIELLQTFLAQGVHLAAGGDGAVDRMLLEPYFIDDDAAVGRKKDRVLNLEEMIAQAQPIDEDDEDFEGAVTLRQEPRSQEPRSQEPQEQGEGDV